MAPKKNSTAPAAKKQKKEGDEEVSQLTLQKQFHSAVTYKSAKDTPEQAQAKQEALAMYLSLKGKEKSECLAKFQEDRSLKWVGSWAKSFTEKKETVNATVQGWMTMEGIMELKKVCAQNPAYEKLWEALKATLVEREHEEPSWAALGMKQWFYLHNEHQRVSDSSASGTELSGKASGKGHQHLLNGSAPAEVVVLHPEHVACKAKFAVNRSAAGKLNSVASDVGKLVASLKVDVDNDHSEELAKLGQLVSEIRERVEEMSVLDARFESLDKGESEKLEKLSGDYDDARVLCEAHLKGWGEYSAARKAEQVSKKATASN